MRLFLLAILLITSAKINADNYVWISPEVYNVHRTRQGGTRQNGWAGGVRLGYDRIKDWGFYWGADTSWAQGPLKGRSGGHDRIKSTLTDISVEGRAGFTFSHPCVPAVFFTPYAGYGYFQETNDFRAPSPVPAKFRIQYRYAAFGGILFKQFSAQWGAGVNFKCRWMIDGDCRVTNDPDFNSLTMKVEEKPQYRLELPVVYYPGCLPFFCLSPFYEYRQYGEHPNFPFDFMETKLQVLGISLKIIWDF